MAEEETSPIGNIPEGGVYEGWEALELPVGEYDHVAMLDHMMAKRFPAIMLYDPSIADEHMEDFPGRLLDSFKTASRMIVYIHEYAIIIGVGDMAYSEYGNWGNMINAIKEIMRDKIPEQWKQVEFDATHETLEDAAWAIGKSLELPINEEYPRAHAFEIAQRVMREKRRAARVAAAKPKR